MFTGHIWIDKDAYFLHMDDDDWSDREDVQADLSVHWAHNWKSMFSENAAHTISSQYLHKGLIEFLASFAYVEGSAQDCSHSNIFLKPLFRGNFDPFVNNANLGAIAHTSNGT